MIRTLKKFLGNIDWPLLLLLTVVANQAVLWLKVVGLLAVFVFRWANVRKVSVGSLPHFVPLIALLGILHFLFFNPDFSGAAWASLGVSTAFWIAAFAGTYHVHLSLKSAPQRVLPTLEFFVLLNAAFSLFQVAYIAWLNGVWNPYNQLPFPYGMSTGDLVMGIFGEASYNNAFVSGLLAIFFLFRRQWVYATLCMLVEILVFGNIIILSLAGILGIGALLGLLSLALRRQIPFFQSAFFPKGSVVAAFGLSTLMLLGFVAGISVENAHYILSFTNSDTPNGKVKVDENGTNLRVPLRKRVAQLDFTKYSRRVLPADALDLQTRQRLTAQSVAELKGKKLSFLETAAYLQSGLKPLLLGAGAVRFSSLTAARMSGLDSSRIFTRLLPRYVSRTYNENHRLIHKYRVAGDDALLSNANWPDSFYNQLAGEYGLVGIGLFLFFYVGYYLKRWRKLSWGIWVSALMIPIAALTYLFEPLCVIFFFELLLGFDLVEEKPSFQSL